MVKIADSIRLTIEKFSNDLKKRFHVKNIYIYGSYSKGSYDLWSDIDLAVIVDDENSHSKEIFSMAKEYDIRFDALGFSQRDFETSALSIIPEIKKHGVKIV